MAPAVSTLSHAQSSIGQHWVATGRPEEDLPSWTREPARWRVRIASHTVASDSLRGAALADAARLAFSSAIAALPGGPCRVWSFLPRPTDRDGDTLERYMHFNAGRTAAFASMPERMRVMPAGTCVGHAGDMLVVHALWMECDFRSIENPRQKPAWQYSSRYGPVPPAFARASRTPDALFASGTAAVVGEDSEHPDSLEAQFDETLRNLDALANAGGATGPWRSVQVYVRDAEDLAKAHALCCARFGAGIDRVLHAPICRRELLIEIEGVCDATAAPAHDVGEDARDARP